MTGQLCGVVNRGSRLLTLSRLGLIYFVIFAIAFALTEIGRYVLRPFVYRNGIDDFGIADTMGNHLGTITQVFFILGVAHANRRGGFLIIAVVVLGYVGYEFVQGALPGSTFDWKDVIRFSYTNSTENIIEGLNRIENYLDNL